MAEKGLVDSSEQPADNAPQTQRQEGEERTILTVGPGCVTVTSDRSAVLQSAPLGSGVAVVLYSHDSAVGGMLHFFLPDGSIDEARRISWPALFADSGIELLLHQMRNHGAAPPRLHCHVVGGADPMHLGITEPTLSLGSRNAAAAVEILEKVGLSAAATRTGGHRARRVNLDVATGSVRVTEMPADRRLP